MRNVTENKRSKNGVCMSFATRAASCEASSLFKKVCKPQIAANLCLVLIGGSLYTLGWYNDPDFPPNKPVQPGLDPIFSQMGKEDQSVYRSMSGANPNYEQELMTFPHKFINPRGGEYFFAPSISTLRDYIVGK